MDIVLNETWDKVEEFIISGSDNDTSVLGFDTIDEMLDAILLLKDVISKGLIPVFTN